MCMTNKVPDHFLFVLGSHHEKPTLVHWFLMLAAHWDYLGCFLTCCCLIQPGLIRDADLTGLRWNLGLGFLNRLSVNFVTSQRITDSQNQSIQRDYIPFTQFPSVLTSLWNYCTILKPWQWCWYNPQHVQMPSVLQSLESLVGIGCVCGGGGSLNFALCVEACSHQYNPDVELLHYHQDLTSFICSSFQLQSTPLPTIPNPGQSLISSPSLSFCYFRNVYTDRIIQDMSFWDWLFSVNGISMKFIQVFKYISSLCYLLIVAFNCMNIP